MSPFRCEGRFIRDGLGRVRIFRGVNVSGRAKLPPFLALDDPRALERLAAWGMNTIRLLVVWEGLEPERGEFDAAYLERVAELAEYAGRCGLHVVVDFHQDLFSRVFGGDGAPTWAVRVRGPAAHGRGWFYQYGLNAGVRGSQAAFWRDDDGIQTAFFGAARRVLARMREVPCVLGYDGWNEPMSGIRSLVSGAFERKALAAFYRRFIGLRDAADPTRLVFFEPTSWVAFGIPTALPKPAGGNLVYAPHLYDATAITLGRYRRLGSTFATSLQRIDETAQRYDVPLFIGEFGALGSVGAKQRMVEDECQVLDASFASWTAWHFNPSAVDWNDEGASIVDQRGDLHGWATPLLRPYPRALAGEPRSWTSQGAFDLTWRAAGPAHTEIVLPPGWRDADIAVHGASYERDRDVLIVAAASAAAVRVQLMPRRQQD